MAQAQGCAILVTDDQRLVVLGFFQLVVGLDLPVASVCQSYELNAFRSGDVRQVNDRANFGVSQVNFDEFRQVLDRKSVV